MKEKKTTILEKANSITSIAAIVVPIVAVIFGFGIVQNSQSIQIEDIQQDIEAAKLERRQLDRAKQEILIQVNTVQIQSKHNNELLQEIKAYVKP